jgi:predicted  nucleic acid-binding Zn-ribbon protein
MEESVQQQAMEREAMHKEIAALEEQATGAEEQIAKLAEQVLELEEKVGRHNPWLETTATVATEGNIVRCWRVIQAFAFILQLVHWLSKV